MIPALLPLFGIALGVSCALCYSSLHLACQLDFASICSGGGGPPPPSTYYCTLTPGGQITSQADANACCAPPDLHYPLNPLPTPCPYQPPFTADVVGTSIRVGGNEQRATSGFTQAMNLISGAVPADNTPPTPGVLSVNQSAATGVNNTTTGKPNPPSVSAGSQGGVLPWIQNLGNSLLGTNSATSNNSNPNPLPNSNDIPSPIVTPGAHVSPDNTRSYYAALADDSLDDDEAKNKKGDSTGAVPGSPSSPAPVLNFNEMNAGPEKNPFLSGDPEEYFTFIGIEENIFKRIHVRYQSIALSIFLKK